MSFLLDTNICSAYLKGHRAVANRFVQHAGALHISVITVGELYSWVYRAKTAKEREVGLQDLISGMVILDIDHEVARTFGRLRASLLDQGRPTPEMDLLIASTPLHHDLTLVTHNVADFSHLPNLRILDWLAP